MQDRVLYVSPVWTNLADYKLSDTAESGMPAFSEPLKLFIESGYSVDLLWVAHSSSPALADPFLASQPKVFVPSVSKLGLLFSTFKVFISTVLHIRKLKSDIVFCHGALSVGAILAAVVMRRKTVVRVYGTNKYSSELIRLGKWKFFLRYPLVFLMFYISSRVLIATDDGSESDKIFSAIGRAKEFYFLKNGFPVRSELPIAAKPIFLCVGRIGKKKNQIAALEFFEKVANHSEGSRLKFIGEVSSYPYLEELKGRIESSRFSSRVEILGPMPKTKLYEHYKEADAILSFQEYSNFGNVAIECLTLGCLFITYNEDSFRKLSDLSNHPVALCGESIDELAALYGSLDAGQKQQIRDSGQHCITRELHSWAERASIEVEIVTRQNHV